MIKIIRSSILIATVLFSMSACSKKAPEDQKPQMATLATQQLPAWVLDPSIPGTISAVGIAPSTQGGIKVQIAQAEADARANIASTIEVRVSRVTKDAVEKANVDNKEGFMSSFSQATKEIIKDVPISGAVRKNIYKDPSDGTLYVLMALNQDIVKQYMTSRADAINSALQTSGASQKTISEVSGNLSRLFDEIK